MGPARRANARRASFTSAQALPAFEVADLPVRFVLRNPVFLLDLADELVALAADLLELVIGEIAPLLPDLALELLPVALDLIPVHGCSS